MAREQRRTLTGPEAWTGADMAASDAWCFACPPEALAEIDAALAGVRRARLDWWRIEKADFPLPSLAPALAAMAAELEDGCGMARLSGLPVDRYGEDDLRALCFAIGVHLGTPVEQNGQRGLMRDIRDNSANGGTRVDSAGALNWHNDRADVVGLLCVRRARAGGVSRIVSAAAIHNAMLARRPDLVDVLFDDFHRYSPGDEVGEADSSYALPVFAVQDGYFTSHFSRTYIDQAQKLPGIPPLTPAQIEALDLVFTLAEELGFEMPLAPGDMQFLNNHVTYHGRTAFVDDPAQRQDRLLYRLWLSMPNSRPLPASHRVLWGSVEAGALRGGVRAPSAS